MDWVGLGRDRLQEHRLLVNPEDPESGTREVCRTWGL